MFLFIDTVSEEPGSLGMGSSKPPSLHTVAAGQDGVHTRQSRRLSICPYYTSYSPHDYYLSFLVVFCTCHISIDSIYLLHAGGISPARIIGTAYIIPSGTNPTTGTILRLQ